MTKFNESNELELELEIAIERYGKAMRECGFLEGLKRHTWMKDGITYVGNGTYTLREAIEMAERDGIIIKLMGQCSSCGDKLESTDDFSLIGGEKYCHACEAKKD